MEAGTVQLQTKAAGFVSNDLGILLGVPLWVWCWGAALFCLIVSRRRKSR